MAKQIFKDPYGKGNLSLNECKLDKTLLDYESRSERIPSVDENYVDLGLNTNLQK